MYSLKLLPLFFAYVTHGWSYTFGELEDCISCICHAKTACYDLKICAMYSIDYPYYLEASSVKDCNTLNIAMSYEECMKNEDCIARTIHNFINCTQRDCYCDEEIDCRDMFSRHLYRNGCHPISGHKYERRYNNCAKTKGLKQINSNAFCVDFEKAPFSNLTSSYMWETQTATTDQG